MSHVFDCFPYHGNTDEDDATVSVEDVAVVLNIPHAAATLPFDGSGHMNDPRERRRHGRQFGLAGLMAFVTYVALLSAFASAFNPVIIVAMDIAVASLAIANALRLERVWGLKVPGLTLLEWAVVIFVCAILTALLLPAGIWPPYRRLSGYSFNA